MSRERIIESARECIGTPFRHQGRRIGRDGGLDCAGIIRVAGIGGGYVDPAWDFTGYSRFPHPDEIERVLLSSGWMVRVLQSEVRPGDALQFWDLRWSHLGILAEHAGARMLIHTTRADRFCVEHRIDAEWDRRFRRAYRFKGVTD